jgi:glutamyl-tRNA synthetase
MNGTYLRAMPLEEYADALILYLGEQGYDWDAELVHKTVPIVQDKIALLGEYPAFAGFFFEEVEPVAADAADLPMLQAAHATLATLEPFTAEAIEAALRAAADELDLKPRQAFQPIRIAVTGSKISPGLFESIELLGREKTLARLSAAGGAA